MKENPYQTLDRQRAMLRAIPRFPNRIAVSDILAILQAAGYTPTRRTIERDLREMSHRFALTVDDSSKPFGWSWMKDANVEFMPCLTISQSLALVLVQRHLSDLLPKSMFRDLAPVFAAAERELACTGWKDWHKRIAVAPAGFGLLPPTIDPKVLSDVHDALARRLHMTAKYRSKGHRIPRKREIDPLGLLLRGRVQYLVCMLPEHKQPRQLAIHRMSKTLVGTEPCSEPPGFRMSDYAVHELGIGSHGKIHLRAIFKEAAAEHLRETPLSAKQTWRRIPGSDTVEIKATVDDDLQLKRWLLSLGSEVEVMEPLRLRMDMAEELALAQRAYAT